MTDNPAALPYSASNETSAGASEETTRRALPTLSLHASRSALLPALIHNDGPQASRRYLEFFAAQLRNPNTRAAYARAATRFFAWCRDAAAVDQLVQIEPIHVAAWIEGRAAEVSAPTVKQELAALRKLFDWLVLGQVLPASPAAFVRGPSHSVKIGTTPVLTVDQARILLSNIPDDTVSGQRDRALISLMIYSFARISAALALDVGHLFREQHRLNIRLTEKGGKRHLMPCHHTLDAHLVSYMTVTGLGPDPKAPLFQTMARDRRGLSGRRLNRTEAWYMVRRRARAAGIDTAVSCHTFRGTGITAYLEHPDAKLEEAQKMAAHSDPKTTRLYDRRSQAVTIDDVERIRI